MKLNEWFDRMGNVDPRYIEEADPTAATTAASAAPRRKTSWKKWLLVAAACLCTVAIALPLFLMYAPTTSYGHVVSKLDAYWNEQNAVDWKEFWAEGVKGDVMNGGAAPPTAAPDGATGDANFPGNIPEGDNAYQEVTDNQVEGVIEADRIKRTKTHIFYLRETYAEDLSRVVVLEAYTIAGEQSACVGQYKLAEDERYVNGFYLSADGNTITMVIQSSRNSQKTRVLSLDVSNPENPARKGEIEVDGAPVDSRMKDGRLLLVTNYHNQSTYNRNDPATFIPQIDDGKGGGSDCIPEDRIEVPDTVDSPNFTVLVSVNEADLSITDTRAFLSYGSELYASTDTLYLTQTHYNRDLRAYESEIFGVGYENGEFTPGGKIKIDGQILDQYSMDEYDGILRVVTTVKNSNASLFCVDLTTWNIVASVENFAPQGETVQSVRFDKEKAYVCTAVVFRDPVFFFDLSNLDNITVKDTGEIDGFSSSLIQLGDGYLLGVGSDAMGFKIEVYRETDTAVESVAVYRAPDAYAAAGAYIAEEYKSYLVNRAEGLFGFSFGHYAASGESNSVYVLLDFNKETDTLDEVVFQPLTSTAVGINNNRGVVVDDCLYLFCNHADFFAISLAKTE